MIKISQRLQMIAGLVTEGGRLADVGTDHGYIPIWMKQNDRIASAIAMDVNQGPLDSAKEHIHACQLDAYIETRLSDGLDALGKEDADTVVIAGMGGALTIRILQRGLEKFGRRADGSWNWSVRELILQPQSEIDEVRRFLREQGFQIVDEDMLVEDGKYYTAMRAVPADVITDDPEQNGIDKMIQETCSGILAEHDFQNECSTVSMEDLFGPVLLAKKHPVLKEWIQREIRIQEKILSSLTKAGNAERSKERRQEVEERLRLLEHALRSIQ